MRKLRYYLRIHRVLIKQDIKRVLEYRGDFITGILAVGAIHVTVFITLGITFSQIPHLMGWSYAEVLFIYGYARLIKALQVLLFNNLWGFAYGTVRSGDFDRYLIRPVSPLFHVLFERFSLESISELTAGIVALSIALKDLPLNLHVGNIALFICILPFSLLTQVGSMLLPCSAAFWTKRSGNIVGMANRFADLGANPANVYARVVRESITYVFPVAFIAYYPCVYFLRGENPLFNLGGTVIAGVLLFSAAVFFFNRGIKIYESAGS